MGAVEMIENIVRNEGHDVSVEFNEEGRLVCRIDGTPYTPFNAAEHFILGGWRSVWQD